MSLFTGSVESLLTRSDSSSRKKSSDVLQTPLKSNHWQEPDPRIGYDFVKRGIDIFGAAALLIILFPLMILVACIVKFTSRGSIIYVQKRLTQGGKVFNMYKFRTMSQNAEAETGAVWAKDNDPRVTFIGKFLRLSRIDELPQLFNVLSGDMSLIGPRPERPELAEELAYRFPAFAKRLKIKAGITGLAQISSGYASDIDNYKKKLALDNLYINKRCIWLDFKIAVATLKVILTGKGAR